MKKFSWDDVLSEIMDMRLPFVFGPVWLVLTVEVFFFIVKIMSCGLVLCIKGGVALKSRLAHKLTT